MAKKKVKLKKILTIEIQSLDLDPGKHYSTQDYPGPGFYDVSGDYVNYHIYMPDGVIWSLPKLLDEISDIKEQIEEQIPENRSILIEDMLYVLAVSKKPELIVELNKQKNG